MPAVFVYRQLMIFYLLALVLHVAAVCDSSYGVGVLMLARPTGSGISFPEIWETWKEGADAWAISHGCNHGAPLRGFVITEAYSKDGVLASDYAVPGWFELLSGPRCAWGDLLRCVREIYSQALSRTDPSYKMFAMVSDDSVPLAPFSEIYAELRRKHVSRIGWLERNFAHPRRQSKLNRLPHTVELCGKYGQWEVLRRDHMSLLSMSDTWVEKQWSFHHGVRWWQLLLNRWFPVPAAAPDEFQTQCYLQRVLGHQVYEAETESFSGAINGKESMYTCWKECEKIGECTPNSFRSSPCTFRSIQAQSLQEIRKRAWFLRKVVPNTTVLTESTPVSLASWLNFTRADYY